MRPIMLNIEYESKKKEVKKTKHLLLIFSIETALHTFRVACGAQSVSNQYHFHQYHFRRKKNIILWKIRNKTNNRLVFVIHTHKKNKIIFFLFCRRRFCFSLDVWNTWKSTQAMIYTDKNKTMYVWMKFN